MRQKGLKEASSILRHLSNIAPHMLRLKEQSNLSEFVLHELCCNKGFGLSRAAYFVDNPDFNCLRGVAGFLCDEAYSSSHAERSIWDDPEAFSMHMGRAPFNQRVRGVRQDSIGTITSDELSLIQGMAQGLGFDVYDVYSWDMKHDNHGILLFERPHDTDATDEHFRNGVSLLGFCPLF